MEVRLIVSKKRRMLILKSKQRMELNDGHRTIGFLEEASLCKLYEQFNDNETICHKKFRKGVTNIACCFR